MSGRKAKFSLLLATFCASPIIRNGSATADVSVEPVGDTIRILPFSTAGGFQVEGVSSVNPSAIRSVCTSGPTVAAGNWVGIVAGVPPGGTVGGALPGSQAASAK